MKNDLQKQLIDAAYHYDIEGMRRLLAEGADFNAIDPEEGDSAFAEMLHRNPWHDRVSEMLRLGANPNVAASVSGTPLIYAASQLDLVLLEMLLDAGADPNTPGYIDEEPMAPLDAVYDGYHCHKSKPFHMLLDAMELLLKSRGAKCYHELQAKS